jgi:hypothetical protein
MVAVSATPMRFDMGRIVGRTFSAVGKNFVLYFALGLIFAGGPALMMGVGQGMATAEQGSPLGTDPQLYIGGAILNMIGTYVLQAALTHGAVVHFNARRASLGDCLATGLRFFLPIFAIALLWGIGVILGLMLLVVPGLILMSVWAVVAPAEVVERTGVFGAFSRSAALTRDHRWSIFLLGLALWILTTVVSMVTLAVAGIVSTAGWLSVGWAIGIAQSIINPIVSIITAVGVASLYFELRSVKEGIGVEELAAVFD